MKSDPVILAIDPSLTSSGHAFRDYDTITHGRIMPKTLRGVQRLAFIEETFLDLVDRAGAEALVMEGYSMGSRGRVFDIGELGGVLKLCAFKHDIEVLVVPPATLKKWVTGKGNADKKAMVAAVKKKWKVDTSNNDECDAVALLHFGEFYYTNAASRRKPAAIRELISKCELLE